MDIGGAIVLGLIWLANGVLVIVFWLLDHAFPLLSIPAFYLLASRAPRQQRPFALACGILGVLTAVLIPPPVPLVVLLMAWAGVIVVALDRFNPDAIRWRVVGALVLYSVAALGWTGYSTYVAGVAVDEWAGIFATGEEAASALAQSRSAANTVGSYAILLFMPLGYAGILIQYLVVHPPLPTSPAKIIHTVRSAGGEEGRQAGHQVGQEEPTRRGWWWGAGR